MDDCASLILHICMFLDYWKRPGAPERNARKYWENMQINTEKTWTVNLGNRTQDLLTVIIFICPLINNNIIIIKKL